MVLQLGKAIGWKVIGVAVGVIGSIYLYEYLSWTNKAKERAFKQQYVAFARQKLRLIVDMMSVNCSHQVKRSVSNFTSKYTYPVHVSARSHSVSLFSELQSTFSNLARLVDVSKGDLTSQLTQLRQVMTKVDDINGKAKKLR